MFVKRREHKSQKCHHPIPSGRIARRAELNIVRQGLVICSFPARPQPSIYLQRYSTVGKAFKLFNCCQMISNVSAPQMQSPETPQNRRNQSNQGNDTPGSLRSKIITKQPKVGKDSDTKNSSHTNMNSCESVQPSHCLMPIDMQIAAENWKWHSALNHLGAIRDGPYKMSIPDPVAAHISIGFRSLIVLFRH